MSASSVTSSSLDFARRLSVRLSQAALPPQDPSSEGTLPYVRFTAPPSRVALQSQPEPEATGSSSPSVSPEDPRMPSGAAPVRVSVVATTPITGSWEEFLGWCRHHCSADAVFVIDQQGLVMAKEGDVSSFRLEDLAAEVVLGLSQCAMVGGTGSLKALAFHFDSRYMLALSAASPEPMVLVLLCPGLVPDAAVQLLLDCWPNVATELL